VACRWAVIGAGPSVTQAQVNAVRYLPTIAVNTSFRLAPWARIVYAHDRNWWEIYGAEVAKLDAKRYTMQPSRWAEQLHGSKSRAGLCLDGVHGAKDSGHGAINVAFNQGARHIILIGFDYLKTDKAHWHGDHPKALKNADDIDSKIPALNQLAADLKKQGARVYNCSPNSALDCFERCTVGEALIASRFG
jgi:hypothetical protein